MRVSFADLKIEVVPRLDAKPTERHLTERSRDADAPDPIRAANAVEILGPCDDVDGARRRELTDLTLDLGP